MGLHDWNGNGRSDSFDSFMDQHVMSQSQSSSGSSSDSGYLASSSFDSSGGGYGSSSASSSYGSYSVSSGVVSKGTGCSDNSSRLNLNSNHTAPLGNSSLGNRYNSSFASKPEKSKDEIEREQELKLIAEKEIKLHRRRLFIALIIPYFMLALIIGIKLNNLYYGSLLAIPYAFIADIIYNAKK